MTAAPARAAAVVIVRARTHPWCHTASARSPACGDYWRVLGRCLGQDRYVNELKERLRADLTSAMRSRDQVRLRTLRMALTSITNEERSGDAAHELSDEDILKVLTREAKKRREAAEAYDVAGRADQAEAE